ncbi:Glucooligosaccharide oxidase [Xylariaceae sp. AK1471]|nr:Glucooligosaccharide oxidase [Xylariaceae sp. AK1471]
MGTPIVRSLERLGIPIKTPLDADWEFYSSTYNVRVPAKPEIVILPETIEQVAQAVVCASRFGLKVQARCGGHSYASHSNGGVDGSAVVDLRKLQDIELGDNGVVRVGGGVRLGNLARTIYQRGDRALAHGTCPAVGIGGHFTHGGYSLASRAWGLSMDQIVALDVVMADGKVVRASASENKDLFYAMRGAADSFGIAVNFYLRTQPAPKTVIKWSVDVPEAMRSVEGAVTAFQHVQDFANNPSIVDRRLGLVLFLDHHRFSIEGQYLGDLGTFTSSILPTLLHGFPQKGATKVEYRQVDWLTCLRLLAGGMDIEVGANYEEHHVFFAKSAAVPHPGLSREALKNYFEFVMREGASAPVGYFLSAQLYGGADSQVTANKADDAFGHRDTMWMFQHYAFVDDKAVFPEEGMAFVEGVSAALGAGFGAYNNYPDPLLAPGEAQRKYYGEKLGRLAVLKGVLDPEDVFAHPQSVKKL